MYMYSFKILGHCYHIEILGYPALQVSRIMQTADIKLLSSSYQKK